MVSTDQTSAYAMLNLDGQQLLLPQNDIRTLEPVADVDTDTPPSAGIGWIDFEETQWPVYCLSKSLNTLSEIPPRRRICVLLTPGEGCFGLLCNELVTLHGQPVRQYPLPDCMTKPGTLIEALVLQGDGIGLVSSASRLEAFLTDNKT